jgi:hypothetical protein
MTVKPWLTPDCRKEIGDMIKAEVQTQLNPVLQQVTDVKKETEAQSKLLQASDEWRKKLWGNGSGTKGFLDLAREEDKRRLDAMQAGFDKMQTSIDVERAKRDAVAEALATVSAARETRFTHVTAVLTIVATLFGGGLLALFGEHLLHLVK